MASQSGDILKITTAFKLYTSITIVNVWYLKMDDDPVPDDTTVFDDIAAHYDTAYGILADILTTSLVSDQISVYNVTQDYLVGQGPWPGFTNGNSSVDPVTSGVAFVIRMLVSAKRGQGRKFIGGLTEAATTAGVWNATALTAMGLFLGEVIDWWQAVISGNSFQPVIFRRSTGETFNVLGGILNAIPGYQRRRKEGVGE